jgi:hypothetical protein
MVSHAPKVSHLLPSLVHPFSLVNLTNSAWIRTYALLRSKESREADPEDAQVLSVSNPKRDVVRLPPLPQADVRSRPLPPIQSILHFLILSSSITTIKRRMHGFYEYLRGSIGRWCKRIHRGNGVWYVLLPRDLPIGQSGTMVDG